MGCNLLKSSGVRPMDRQAILDKIAAMLRLQEGSTFDGETAAAAAMIDKLCAKYGVSVDEALTPQVLTEDHKQTKKMNDAEFVLFCAVARHKCHRRSHRS